MLCRARRVASEEKMQIEIAQQYVMILRDIDHNSQYLRQRERAISERVRDRREIVHIVNANHVRVVVEFLNRHFSTLMFVVEYSIFQFFESI